MSYKQNNVLEGKKILLFSQFFFGYEEKIANKMRQMGAEVSLYDEMSVKKAIERAILKVSPGVFHKRTEKYYLDLLLKEKEKQFDYILFIDCEMPTSVVLHNYRQTFPNAKFCLHLWDSLDNLKGVNKKFKFFDHITSFDRVDAERNKIMFRPLFFGDDYRASNNRKQYLYDLSFIGTIHSDRYSIIKKLKGAVPDFYIYPYLQSIFIYYFYKATKKEFWSTELNDFKFGKIDSKEIAQIIDESKAVLDIQHPQQTGLTMRTLEMVGMKKKLVTTNSDIKNYVFYNPNNICIIDRRKPFIPSSFFEQEYIDISEDIYEYYSLDQWVLGVLGI